MNKKIFRILSAIAIIAIIIVLHQLDVFSSVSPEEIRDFIESYGILAPVVYIILFTLVPLTLFPDSILAIAGGMAFGFAQGTIYTMIGALCGGSLSFFIARWLSKQFKKEATGKIKYIIDEQGFVIILLLRLIPLFPFDVISYGAGLSNVKYKDFMLATMIGIIPGVMVFTNIGTQVTQIGSTSFYISIGLLIILLVGGSMFKNRLALRIEEEN